MKKIIYTILAVLGIMFIIPSSFAVEYNDIDDIIIPNITYFPHGVNALGDVELTPSITQVTNDLNTTSYDGKLLYIVTPNRPIIFQYNVDNITYTHSNVSRFEIIFDWYVGTSGRRYIVNIYNNSNQIIETVTYGYSVINFLPSTYLLSVNEYEIGYNDGLNDGRDQAIEIYYNAAKEEYGYYHNGIWITATEWASLEYSRGWNESASAGYGINILGAITEAATFTDHVLSANLGGGFNLYQLFIIPIVFGLMFMLIKMARGG